MIFTKEDMEALKRIIEEDIKMQPMNAQEKTAREAKFIQVECSKMVEQFMAKNVAYNDSFGRQFDKYGPVSALVRMSDKFNRLEALILGAENKVVDERLQDTLVDMACYCLMTLYEIEARE
jgi:hypothetical protein